MPASERLQKRIHEMIDAGLVGMRFTSGPNWSGLTYEEKCEAILQFLDSPKKHLDFKDSYIRERRS